MVHSWRNTMKLIMKSQSNQNQIQMQIFNMQSKTGKKSV